MATSMKLHVVIIFAAVFSAADANANDAPVGRKEPTDANAAAVRIEEALKFLASDELKGRAIGSPEIDQAAEFIVSRFQELGLQTDLFDGSPYQQFSIPGGFKTPSADNNCLEFTSSRTRATKRNETPAGLTLDHQFRPLAIGGSGDFDADVVFVGYGITSPENKFDEYAGVDVQDKVVVILRKEPQQADADSVFNGDKPSNHAFFATKIQNAINHGAIAVVLVNDGAEQARNAKRQIANWKRQSARLARILAEGPASDSIADFQKHRRRVDRLTKALDKFAQRVDEADKLLPVAGAGRTPIDTKVPVMFCLRSAVREMIEQAADMSLEEMEQAIDTTLRPQSMPLTHWRARGQVKVVRQATEVKNIIATLEGEGEIANQTIIIGAHYDHVGMGGVGSLAPWTNEVHNGADDNASGVVALLEVARQISQNKPSPRRRIVFIAFTAEESGLLGSKHYVDHPRFDLNETVAMLNLDMVGRIGDQPLEVNGVGTSRRLEEIVDAMAESQSFSIKKQLPGNGPSDHATFNAKEIPVLHFFSGLHSDYHRPGDDVEKIDINGIVRASKLTATIASEIASQDQRLIYSRPKRSRALRKRGFLGVQVASVKDGCKFTNVVPDSPAADVGLVEGDILIAIDGKAVATIGEMVERLSDKIPGDEVILTVMHEKAQQTFKVKLGESR